jgi:excisionase family DNA binding protein
MRFKKIIEQLEKRATALEAKELAELLNVTPQHVYSMAARGRLPSFRVDNSVRFDPSDVVDWINQQAPKKGHSRAA